MGLYAREMVISTSGITTHFVMVALVDAPTKTYFILLFFHFSNYYIYLVRAIRGYGVGHGNKRALLWADYFQKDPPNENRVAKHCCG